MISFLCVRQPPLPTQVVRGGITIVAIRTVDLLYLESIRKKSFLERMAEGRQPSAFFLPFLKRRQKEEKTGCSGKRRSPVC